MHNGLENVNVDVEWRFVIGQCHGNGVRFDVGVGATCASNVMHKVPCAEFRSCTLCIASAELASFWALLPKGRRGT